MEKDQVATKAASGRVVYWLNELASARKREKNWRKEADDLVEMYEGSKCKQDAYNILYANTDTMAPALYNSTPRPIVQRRYKDADKVGGLAAMAGQRILEYLLDSGNKEYQVFDELINSSVLEALVPGRGITRFKYDADVQEGETGAKVKYETVCGEMQPWNRMLHGYAKKWNQVPWIAFPHYMTKDEVKENFPEVDQMQLKTTVAESTDSDKDSDGETPPRDAELVYVMIWEVLDKKSKTQIFISEGYPSGPLKENQDPWGLQGFFNIPEPLTFVPKMKEMVPVPLYRLYKEQAEELTTVSYRINRLVRALRIRGFYDNSVSGLKELLEQEDNVLLPVDNAAQLFGQGRKLEDALWMIPLDKLVAVYQTLCQQRQQCKQVIYEITGIADIMRGSTQASETLGAQELKNQWGSLRLKRNQKRVMRYVRDCLRIMLELAVGKFSEETIAQMTGLPIMPSMQKQQMMMQMQQLQMTGQQIPPELAQAAQQPSWGEVLALLKNDLVRNFKIDIETNSTVDAEATEDKQNISELLTALSQFLQGISPMIEQGIMPFEAAKAILMAIVRRFRFGAEVESQLEMMTAPKPKDDGKAQAEQIKQQGEQAKMQHEQQMAQTDLQAKQAELQMQQQKLQMQAEFDKQEHAMKMAELQMKMVESQKNHEMKLQQMAMQAAMPAPAPAKPGARK